MIYVNAEIVSSVIDVTAKIVSNVINVTAELIGLNILIVNYERMSYTGNIDGANVTFVCTSKIVQINKNGQIVFETDDYTLSVDGKTATMLVIPNPAFGDKLNFFGNIT
jgi:RNase P/RNase MRP subunit p29